MRKLVIKIQALLSPSSILNAICKNQQQLNQNQSEPQGVSDGVSITVCPHAAGNASPTLN